MLDPVTAFAAATSAFNFIKRAVEAGRELEDVGSQLGTWFGACADLKQAEEESRDPPLFKKLLHKGSVEQEAFQAISRRKAIEDQERQLRELIVYRYGVDTYREMMEERRAIRESRDRLAAKQRRNQKKAAQNLIAMLIVVAILAVPLAFAWLIIGRED